MSDVCEEYCEIYEERYVRARKPHTCCACKATIQPGHRYGYVFTLYDGHVTTYKRCGRCQATHEHLVSLCRDAGDEMWPRDDLGCGLSYQSEWGPVPDDIARLPFLTDDEASALLERKP